MDNIAFGLIIAITLGSALMVVISKQLLYSAIALLFTLFGVQKILFTLPKIL